VGHAGILKDARYKDLSHTLTGMEGFDPFVITDALMHKGHGDYNLLKNRNTQAIWRSFLRGEPWLWCLARAMTYIPGGPIAKITVVWRYPVDMPTTNPEEYLTKTSAVDANIKSSFPVYENHFPPAECRNG
jgi:hypothetical protein